MNASASCSAWRTQLHHLVRGADEVTKIVIIRSALMFDSTKIRIVLKKQISFQIIAWVSLYI